MQSRPFNNVFDYPPTVNEFEKNVKRFKRRTWLKREP